MSKGDKTRQARRPKRMWPGPVLILTVLFGALGAIVAPFTPSIWEGILFCG